MRWLLHTAGLRPESWSHTLLHAFYVKYRLPHSFIKMAPYQVLTDPQLKLKNLRTFVSRIYVRNPGKIDAKLDHHISNNVFVGYTVTNNNVYYIDDATNNLKIGTHTLFDGAQFIFNIRNALNTAQTLQYLGYVNFDNKFKGDKSIADNALKIQRLTIKAPSESTSQSIVLDLYHSG